MLLPGGVTDLIAEGKVFAVLSAEQVAMHEQGGRASTGNDGIIRQQLGADTFGELWTEQEVPVTALHEQTCTAGAAVGESFLGLLRQSTVIVITDPCFIEIAEDIQGFDAMAVVRQQVDKLGGGFRTDFIQMQIGYEYLAHGTSATRI
jgi:hypothetical protein